MTTATPGPLAIESDPDGAPGMFRVFHAATRQPVCWRVHTRADAERIAAGPELVAALELIAALDTDGEASRIARAALAPRYGVEHVARQWGLAPRTVVKWIQSGRLKPTQGSDRETWRFTAEALNTFHAEHGFSATHMPTF